ncbi:histidine kinase dimerization/phosphoacceptor domain -containing protein [Fibrella sp. WM1]|uniref:sensor histidine kinase n=1 Tax=Fibrella musci TaxID=3242485 RepID=UPI0035210400
MPYFLLHTNSIMSLCLTIITGSVWLFLLKSSVRTPIRNWLTLFYFAQTVWQFSEIFHYSIHPDYVGSLAYKLLLTGWDLPALALLETAYVQVNYLFIQDSYPKERRLMLRAMTVMSVLFCGFIAWNEFSNDSNISLLNFAGFLYGTICNSWALIVCIRKIITLHRQQHPDSDGIRWLTFVNIIFVIMCVLVVTFGFYSTIGYWTYCSLLWSGNLAQIVVYLNFAAVPINLKTKQLGFAQVTVASILLTVMLVFCPPVDILDLPPRLLQQPSLLKITLLIIGTATINIVLLPHLIKKTLTDPVLRLLAGVQHVNAGDLSIQVVQTTQDEVGILTQHFNQMTQSLHNAHAELTRYAQTLEEQVADRTAELRADKARIEEQSMQLQTVMRELHHRVKNNLAIVSGLLSLQLNRLEDQQAMKAFQEGQRRIEAIALIHQRLYQSQELTAIDMGQFVEELTLSTMLAYGYQPGSIELNINSDVEVLDIDMAVPLSLIINELLTNCFKYAIPNVPDPSLSISLLKQNGLLLEVADNGPGINIDLWNKPSTSFGKRLIKGLSEQTGGILTVENRMPKRSARQVARLRDEPLLVAEHMGTLFRLAIPDLKLMQ